MQSSRLARARQLAKDRLTVLRYTIKKATQLQRENALLRRQNAALWQEFKKTVAN
jgi:hypothetical protein